MATTNYKAQMHKRCGPSMCGGLFSVFACRSLESRLTIETTDDWERVTCKNCLRCRPKPKDGAGATEGATREGATREGEG